MDQFPFALAIAVFVQVSCQLFKFVYYSIRRRRISLRYLATAGGFPSAHTAFVTALTVAIGIRGGGSSDLFAVAAVFSAIVVYDSFRLRGHVQNHARIINRHVLSATDEEPVSEMVGHSIPEILAGLAFGGGLSAVATVVLG
ncbi:MAG: divergent PAP2 family protein [Spirochaetaceae bacterium]|nr:divergent PAP2 family protein [Spirochaetaceae bacterium]